MSYIKVYFYNKHHLFYRYVQTEYMRCNLKTNIAKCTNFVQCAFYSTNLDFKDTNKNSDSAIDPRVEALKDKLLYSDYLHCDQVRLGRVRYMRKLLDKKIEKSRKLTIEPVPSIIARQLFNEEYGDKKDAELLKAKEERKEENEEENLETMQTNDLPVQMPFSNVDEYSITKEKDKKKLHSLNEDIKKLYKEYLQIKERNPEETKDLTFETFLADEFPDSDSDDELSNVPRNWMLDYSYSEDPRIDYFSEGKANPNIKVSSVPCGGCGALLHCKDQAIPGFIPAELFVNRNHKDLKSMICQRCHFLKTYNTALKVQVSADEYTEILKVIKTKYCSVILMIDLTDFPCSIWPEIKTVLHDLTPVFVVGNKIDLLPPDTKKFHDHVKNCLRQYVEATGIKRNLIRDVILISAKTGYGIEELISKLYSYWKCKGDIYVIGCTNVGKSSLFNTLVQSDYCKAQAADVLHRATVSQWPGTTLNLLKFPIMKPAKWRQALRMERLKDDIVIDKIDEERRRDLFKATRNLKYITPQRHVGRTFLTNDKIETNPFTEKSYKHVMPTIGLDENAQDFVNSRWCYDTPGTIQPDQILDLLTTEELVFTLPKYMITPRTFILKPDQTLFLAGLGRLDYINGNDYIRCTVFAHGRLPVTMCHTIDAEEIYNELLHTPAFVVPVNNPKRLKVWPSLESKELEITGISRNESVADIVLSSAGWIAIAPDTENRIVLKAWTPQGRGIHLRTPALLRKSVALRGQRIFPLPAYRKGSKAYVD